MSVLNNENVAVTTSSQNVKGGEIKNEDNRNNNALFQRKKMLSDLKLMIQRVEETKQKTNEVDSKLSTLEKETKFCIAETQTQHQITTKKLENTRESFTTVSNKLEDHAASFASTKQSVVASIAKLENKQLGLSSPSNLQQNIINTTNNKTYSLQRRKPDSSPKNLFMRACFWVRDFYLRKPSYASFLSLIVIVVILRLRRRP